MLWSDNSEIEKEQEVHIRPFKAGDAQIQQASIALFKKQKSAAVSPSTKTSPAQKDETSSALRFHRSNLKTDKLKSEYDNLMSKFALMQSEHLH